MVDDRSNTFDATNFKLVNFLCDRRYGIGADGLILLRNSADYDFQMIYFNADGYEGSMCGNGGRCIVQFAHDLGLIANSTTFIAVDGEHKAHLENGLVHLKMTDVNHIEAIEEDYFLDTGSPHYVSYRSDLTDFPVVVEGKSIRDNERFKAEGTNVNFIQDLGENKIRIRTYERGVENETLSCGTGATACAISAHQRGMSSPIQVAVEGGQLAISFDSNENHYTNIYLIGPATSVFEGSIDV